MIHTQKKHQIVGKKSITYSECVSVTLVIQHATRMRHIILFVTCLALPYFFQIFSWKARFSEQFVEHKTCVLIFSTAFVWNISQSMAVCGNHIQRVKIVINDNIIEQVTDFKYLGYRISEYKSDLKDKLQTYNKINGAIRR